MTKERAAYVWPFIKAFSEGKQIQFHDSDRAIWIDVTSDLYMPINLNFRIKPEPRTFKLARYKDPNMHPGIGLFVLSPDYQASTNHLEVIEVREIL
jgi:hypothetical protein